MTHNSDGCKRIDEARIDQASMRDMTPSSSMRGEKSFLGQSDTMILSPLSTSPFSLATTTAQLKRPELSTMDASAMTGTTPLSARHCLKVWLLAGELCLL